MRLCLRSLTVALLVLSCYSGTSAWAQTPIVIGEIVDGTISRSQAAPEFVLSATGGTFLSIICDTPDRDVDLTVSLFDHFGNRLGVSTEMNFPENWGAYLAFFLPSTSDYTLRVEGEILTEAPSAVFRLMTREYVEDEPDGLALSKDKTFEGLIGWGEDLDIYGIYLEESKGPVWVTLRTPFDVLDGFVGVSTEEGEELGFNDDFIDTSPVVLFQPPEDGIYFIFVRGAFLDSVGPYELTVQTVWELASIDEDLGGVDEVGASTAYFFDLTPDQVVSILVESETPGFRTTFVFFDAWRRLVTINQADETGMAGILGFTPIMPGPHVAVVFGVFDEETGEYRLVSREESDEPDRRTLALEEDSEGIIGPAGDTDSFTFEGVSGDRMSVWVWPTTPRLDSAVHLIGPSGELVASNDDAVSLVGSLISGVFLQETGLHTVEVLASPLLPDATGAAGPYILSVTEGTLFDIEPPRVRLDILGFEHVAGQAGITIPTDAVADDTWPITGTVTRDRTGESQTFAPSLTVDSQVVFTADPREIFFLVLEDEADDPHSTDPLLIPPPVLVADQVGMPYGLAVRQTGEVLFIDTFSGAIVEIDAAGGVNAFAEGIETKGGLFGPNALAFDHQGQLYLSNALTGEIVRYVADGATEIVAADLDFPVSLAFDADNRLVVALLGSDVVAWIEPDGSLTTITGSIRNPSDLAFGPDGLLYVTSRDVEYGTVFVVDQNGIATALVEPFARELDSLAFDTEGNLYLAAGPEGWIWRLSADGQLQEFAWGFPGPTDLAFGRGEDADVLYIAAMGATWSSFFSSTVARAQTGRTGLPLPYSGTGISGWFLH